MKRKKFVISPLLPIGLLVMSAPFVINRFTEISDFDDGILRGIGVGLILLALLLPKFRTLCSNGDAAGR